MQQTNQSAEMMADPQERLDSSAQSGTAMAAVDGKSQRSSNWSADTIENSSEKRERQGPSTCSTPSSSPRRKKKKAIMRNIGSAEECSRGIPVPASQAPTTQYSTPSSKDETFYSCVEALEDLPASENEQGNQSARIAVSDYILISDDNEVGAGNVDNQSTSDEGESVQSPSPSSGRAPSETCARDLNRGEANSQSSSRQSPRMHLLEESAESTHNALPIHFILDESDIIDIKAALDAGENTDRILESIRQKKLSSPSSNRRAPPEVSLFLPDHSRNAADKTDLRLICGENFYIILGRRDGRKIPVMIINITRRLYSIYECFQDAADALRISRDVLSNQFEKNRTAPWFKWTSDEINRRRFSRPTPIPFSEKASNIPVYPCDMDPDILRDSYSSSTFTPPLAGSNVNGTIKSSD